MTSIFMAVDNGCQLLMYPILGAFIDWYGRRSLMITSICGLTAGFAVIATGSATIDDINAIWLVMCLSALLKGSTEVHWAVLPAAIADVITDKGEQQSVFSGITALQMVASTVSNVTFVIVLALDLTDYTYVWIGMTIISALTLLFVVFVFPETFKEDDRVPINYVDTVPFFGVFPILFNSPKRILFPIAVLCGNIILAGYVTSVPPFMQSEYNMRQSEVGLVMLSFSIFFAVTAGCYSSLVPCMGGEDHPQWTYAYGFGLLVVGLILQCFATYHVLVMVVSILIIGFGGGLLYPAYKVVAVRLEPAENQGKLQAALVCVGLLGTIAGYLLFGTLVKMSGIGSDKCDDDGVIRFSGLPFLVLVGVSLCGFVVACTFAYYRDQQINTTPELSSESPTEVIAEEKQVQPVPVPAAPTDVKLAECKPSSTCGCDVI